MGGRFGKYGDFKRRKALERGRREKTELDRPNPIALRSRNGLFTTPKRPSLLSATKTYKTAVVAILPEYLWGPIHGLRKQYDRHYRRWMPHITLLYPFRPVSAFGQVLPRLAQVCLSFKPFKVQLARFGLFAHSHRNATLYLIA